MHTRYLAGLLLLVTMPAIAAPAIDVSRSADSQTTIQIDNLAGHVRIVGWSKSRLQIGGALGADDQQLKVTGGQGRIEVRVIYPRRGEDEPGATLIVHVPKASPIEATTVTAPIDVSQVAGSQRLESVSGDISLQSMSPAIRAETVSGNIRVVNAHAGLQGARLKSTAGNLMFEAPLDPSGAYDFHDVSGGIVLRTSKHAHATFAFRTVTGTIHNAFGPGPGSAPYSPSQSLRFTNGHGGADVRAETVTGDIALQVSAE